MRLPDLLKLLRENGVTRFKGSRFEIELNSNEIADNSPSKIIDAPVPPNMPEELRNLDTMNADQVLGWSAPPGPNEDVAPIPLTDDKPISAE